MGQWQALIVVGTTRRTFFSLSNHGLPCEGIEALWTPQFFLAMKIHLSKDPTIIWGALAWHFVGASKLDFDSMPLAPGSSGSYRIASRMALVVIAIWHAIEHLNFLGFFKKKKKKILVLIIEESDEGYFYNWFPEFFFFPLFCRRVSAGHIKLPAHAVNRTRILKQRSESRKLKYWAIPTFSIRHPT